MGQPRRGTPFIAVTAVPVAFSLTLFSLARVTLKYYVYVDALMTAMFGLSMVFAIETVIMYTVIYVVMIIVYGILLDCTQPALRLINCIGRSSANKNDTILQV